MDIETNSPIRANNTNGSNVSTLIDHSINGPEFYSVEHFVATSIILGLLILCTILGNALVIVAILFEKSLHNVANFLILSLAVADFVVASVVMPISAANEISRVWFFSTEVCDMWVSLDVLSCTASINNLLAISLDRYWAVTNIAYSRNRSVKRILIMIACVWLMATAISITPLFGWKDKNDPTKTGVCIVSQNHSYVIFATGCGFYLPTVALLLIYSKMFHIAKQRIHNKNRVSVLQDPENMFMHVLNNTPVWLTDISATHKGLCVRKIYDNDGDQISKNNGHISEEHRALFTDSSSIILRDKRKKDKLEIKRERKAARTIAIITGAFIVCWLPFFTITLLMPFVQDIFSISILVQRIVLWLGYCNSLLNPIIYTVFNSGFRGAFRKILLGSFCKNNNSIYEITRNSRIESMLFW